MVLVTVSAKEREEMEAMKDYEGLQDRRVDFFISESLPLGRGRRKYSIEGYNRIEKWEYLDAVKAMEIPPPEISFLALPGGKIKTMAGGPTYGEATLVLDGCAGKESFKRAMKVLRRAARSVDHWTLAVRYPDGERHFLDVLVISATEKKKRGRKPAEMRSEIAIYRAPVIQERHVRP